MERKIIDNYIKAGKIVAQIREETKLLVKPGAKLIDIAEFAEKRIKELGGIPAWPLNISINEIAAHYSPSKADDSVVGKNDLVKLDFGVAVDGYIADTAVSVALDKNDEKLVEAPKKALEEALKLIKIGADLSEVATKIEETIVGMGYKPIVNLTGHGLDQYTVHSNPKVPNHKSDFHYILQEGDVIAIEPFATSGRNFITESEGDLALTYTIIEEKPVRSMDARIILDRVRDRKGMPFTDRWLEQDGIKLRIAMKELTDRGVMDAYRILKGDSKISQAEHTVLVLDKPIVITR